MELEFLATDVTQNVSPYSIDLRGDVVDWGVMLSQVLWDLADHVDQRRALRATGRRLAGAIATVAESAGIEKVVLTGGCFQNKLLTELAVERLQKAGFRAYWHQRVPPNDGGISLGQVVAAKRELAKRG